jgi:hypothetical protein
MADGNAAILRTLSQTEPGGTFIGLLVWTIQHCVVHFINLMMGQAQYRWLRLGEKPADNWNTNNFRKDLGNL